jgi:glycosyltransferase A (GT-A) superfamily protein (DUF2064 family)
MKTDALLILSVPELGKVKTRLAKTIGNEKLGRLQRLTFAHHD